MNAYLEKYAMQIHIESETMVLMARQMILPAAIQHQTRLAAAVQATTAAGVECPDQKSALQEWVDLVFRLNATLNSLAEVDNHHEEDALAHAKYVRQSVMPVMDALREIADELETRVATDLWPLPSYRDLLFIK